MTSRTPLTPHLARRLTARAQEALSVAFSASPHGEISSQRLLVALTQTSGSLAGHALGAHRINLSKNKTEYASNPDEVKRVLKKAAHIALKYHQQFIGTEHLLYGLVDKAQNISLTPLQRKRVKGYLEELFESTSSFGDLRKNPNPKKAAHAKATKSAQGRPRRLSGIRINVKEPSPTPTLDRFCDNLSQQAMQGTLDPLVGRTNELDRLLRILTRRTKNNPLLVGEPGVGKSALIAGLAERIEEGEVPSSLAHKRIYALNLNALIAGTTFRGEFEERMRDLAEEASRDDILLFIDEIHTLVGAGAAQGSLDAANILKPALVTGRFQCIGATTFEEFKKSIEKDGALDRRFQKIIIREETPQESKETLARLAPLYEQHHHVRIPAEIISLCVDLAVRYLPQRTLPDKALDLLDEACSKTVAEVATTINTGRVHRLQQQIGDIIRQKTTATRAEHYAKASRLKQEQELLEAQLVEQEMPELASPLTVREESLRHVVAEMASIPLSSVRRTKQESLVSFLGERIVGQERAVGLLAQAIQRGTTDVRDVNRPVGSFLFVGPSGVGKTHAAKTLAEALRGDSASFIKLDMSEFSESHTVSRLIGAPAGYVGYEDAGFLTDRIRRNPASVVLFDEIEKAHPRVFNTLLQILEDGVLTDAQGKESNFKHAIIILTSNTPSGTEGGGRLGFSSSKSDTTDEVRETLSRHLRPEVLNRIDEIIAFEALNAGHMKTITQQHLAALAARLAPSVQLTVSPRVVGHLADRASSSPQGARAVRSLVTTLIENPLSSHLAQTETRTVRIGIVQGEISISYS